MTACDTLKVEGTDIRTYCIPYSWAGVFAPMAPVFSPVQVPGLPGVFDHGGTLVEGPREVQIGVNVYTNDAADSRGNLRSLLNLCAGTPPFVAQTLRFETDFGSGVEFVEVEARFLAGSPADPVWNRAQQKATLVLPFLVVSGDISDWSLVGT